jgi:hypothetical protein
MAHRTDKNILLDRAAPPVAMKFATRS